MSHNRLKRFPNKIEQNEKHVSHTHKIATHGHCAKGEDGDEDDDGAQVLGDTRRGIKRPVKKRINEHRE